MSNYSDDKNPHYYDWPNGELRPTPTAVRDYLIFRQGFWAGEKDKADELAFTDWERAAFIDMLEDHDPNLELWDGDMTGALDSLKKKVLGE